jgi:molecular chaperone HscB
MLNHFTLFQMQPCYFIDKEELENKYFGLQMQYHPDRMVGKSEAEKISVIKKSADINEAYAVLNDDVERANHLLELNNIRVNKEKDNTYKPSQTLLIEQMELRERASDAEDLDALLNYVETEFDKARKEFNKSFDAKDFEASAQKAMKLKYLDKLKFELQKH